MTAIVVSKKKLPSFSEKRAPALRSDVLTMSSAAHEQSGGAGGVGVSSGAVECALRSALGIGRSGTESPAPQSVQQSPKCEDVANVSIEDPAILDWSLCNPAVDCAPSADDKPEEKTAAARILRILGGDAKEGDAGSAADETEGATGSPPPPASCASKEGASVGPKTVASEATAAEPSWSTVKDGGDGAVSGAASTPAKQLSPEREMRKVAAMREASPSDEPCSGESSSEGYEPRAAPETAECEWISELPGLISSADTDDDDDSPVYSLKPLFTGTFGSSPSKKSKSIKAEKGKRPNYFVAIQVDDINVHKKAKEVQDYMRSQEPKVAQAFVGIPTLHITLLVFRVNDDDDSLQRAKEALGRCHERVREDLEANPLVLEFAGLDHFKKEVLYVKTVGEDSVSRLKAVAEICSEEFTKKNLDMSGNKPFAAHLTLAKLSRTSTKKTEIKKFKEVWYADFVEEKFGSQTVNSLQLLSMYKPKDERGYYYCSLEMPFGNFTRGQEVGDHSECCVQKTSEVKKSMTAAKVEEKLLALDAAKQEVKRTVATLVNAQLKELPEAKDSADASGEGSSCAQ
ncbi:hypothetical protein V5799_003217 [Amblyomma americanum]|uniref:A-kinase anchor protein 7-like phosphoesterase domain-containing protein n=1 Tax=Amblyomma americanum TaxID=6943 RepID=A0AAQ4D9L3_AMBAM